MNEIYKTCTSLTRGWVWELKTQYPNWNQYNWKQHQCYFKHIKVCVHLIYKNELGNHVVRLVIVKHKIYTWVNAIGLYHVIADYRLWLQMPGKCNFNLAWQKMSILLLIEFWLMWVMTANYLWNISKHHEGYVQI